MKTRQYFIISTFSLASLGLCLISYSGHFNDYGSEHAPMAKGQTHDQIEESYFKGVNYFSILKSRPFIELESTELSISNIDGVIVSFDPKGAMYRYDEKGVVTEPIFFQSKNSRALLKKKEIYLENAVEIKMSSTLLKAQKVDIVSNGEELQASKDVQTLSTVVKTNDQILINSDKATYKPKNQFFEYKDHVIGTLKRKKIYEQNIQFGTDALTLDALLGLVKMKGNVFFKKDNLDAQANTGEVFLENYNKKLKYYALYDDVRLQERLQNNGKPFMRKAFAEKLEGLISEKKIILTGFPKVFQERDVIKGNRIIIKENVETVEVDDANTNIMLQQRQD